MRSIVFLSGALRSVVLMSLLATQICGHAATMIAAPDGLGGSLSYGGNEPYADADGLVTMRGSGLIYDPKSLELTLKGVDWLMMAKFAFEPPEVGAETITQSFFATGTISIKLSPQDQSRNVLTGSIGGGTIVGGLGADSTTTITFDLLNLTSDVLLLSGEPAQLSLTSSRAGPLFLACADASQQQACGNGAAYLNWSTLGYSPAWHISKAAFATAVPEPTTWFMWSLGLLFAGVASRCNKYASKP